MKEGSFFTENDLGPESREEISNLERAFLEEEYVSPEFVERTAQAIAADIERIVSAQMSPEEKVSVILEFLNTDELMVLFPQDEENGLGDLMPEDLEVYLAPIRQRILERLEGRGADVHLITGVSDQSEYVWNLHGGKNILKTRGKGETSLAESREEREDRIGALKKLYGLERDRHILYSIIQIDPRSPREQIHKIAGFKTLQELLAAETDLPQGIAYLRDAMRGALFLVQNGLRLSDLASNNIAVHESSGKLFDLDALHTAEGRIAHYMINPRNGIPPERLRPGTSVRHEEPGPITEAEMVFELGKTLGEVMLEAVHPDDVDSAGVDRLSVLRDAMTAQDPAQRPSLERAVDEIENILKILVPENKE